MEKINTPQHSHKTIEGWKLLFGDVDEKIELIELDEKIENTKEKEFQKSSWSALVYKRIH